MFVDAVLATIRSDIGVDLSSERNRLIELCNSEGHEAVIYRLADDNAQTNPIDNQAFVDAEYNRAFVFTQYAGLFAARCRYGRLSFLAGPDERRTASRCLKAARDGLLVHYVSGIPTAL
jgi:hypothetical protein